MDAITKSIEVSKEVANALNTATKAYEIYIKVNQYKETVEAILDGDIKQIAVELLQTAGQEFANSATEELKEYVANINDFVDISKLLKIMHFWWFLIKFLTKFLTIFPRISLN
jgi:hypothetical protein